MHTYFIVEHYGVAIHASPLEYEFGVFIVKLWLAWKDTPRLFTKMLPNILERIMYLIYVVF